MDPVYMDSLVRLDYFASQWKFRQPFNLGNVKYITKVDECNSNVS